MLKLPDAVSNGYTYIILSLQEKVNRLHFGTSL